MDLKLNLNLKPAADAINKIPVKTRIYGFAGLICVLIGLFIYFVRIPMNTEIKTYEKSIVEIQDRIQANEKKIRQLAELKAEVVKLNETLRVMSEQLPLETEVSSLLGQIQSLVTKSGLSLRLWKPEKRKTHASGLYEEIPISLELTGAYHNVGVFFDRIRNLTRIVNILNINLGSAKIDPVSGATDIGVKCTAMTFAAAEKKVETDPNKK